VGVSRGSYADFGRFLTLNWFQTPVKQQIGNKLSKSILFDQSRVKLVKSRDFGKDETTAFNPFLATPRTQLNAVS